MDLTSILEKVITVVIPLVLSLAVHEWAHAYSAYRLGDDTAQRMGRLTLNPIAHIDPVGSLLLPLLLPFGWAKPVPVNPARFHRHVSMSRGMMITAAAGPFSNVVLALICVVLRALLHRFEMMIPALEALLVVGFQLNVILALFNMLPIPPLDGSRVVEGLLPTRARPIWDKYARFGPLVLLAVVLLPSLARVHVLSWPLQQLFVLREHLLFAMLTVGT